MNLDLARSLAIQLVDALAPDAPPTGTMVPLGDNLLSRIEQAPAHAVLVVDPALIGTAGTITLAKPITLVSAGSVGAGRVGPTFQGPILRGAITVTAPGVSFAGFRLEGLQKEQTILTTSHGTTLDWCVVRGSAQGQHRGIRADNSIGVRVTRSWVGNIWADIDTQALSADSGCSDLIVLDSLLEASGENVCFGGSDSPSADKLPRGITIDGCTLSKPIAWKGNLAITCKNLLELKAAVGVRVRRCVAEYAWKSGQDGYGLVLTVRNQNGGSPWTTISDVVIEDTVWRHLGAGINILGRDDTHPSAVMTDVTIQRCTFEDVDPVAWGGAGRQVQIAGGPANLALLDNTFSGQHLNSALTFDQPQFPLLGFRAIGNRWQEGDYGITAAGMALGKPVLDRYAPGSVWERNVIVKGASGRTIAYPAGTTLG